MVNIFNDCPQITADERAAFTAAIAGADSFREYTWSRDGQPPVISWDDDFEDLIDRRAEIIRDYAALGICVYPWQVLAALPAGRKKTDRFYWNQGSNPSCSCHAAVHAIQAAELVAMAMGAPLIYDALNPIYPFYLARGGNLAGGLSIYDTAETANTRGMNAVSEVGDNNLDPPRDAYDHAAESARRQCAIVYIDRDWTDRIFRAAAAGFHIVFGSFVIYTSSRIDRNGVKTGYRQTRGGHAQTFGSYRKTAGTEYVFLTNSHGDIYRDSNEGDPAAGIWLTRGQVDEIADSFDNFGPPFIVLPENPDQIEPTLYPGFAARFPKGWIG